MSRPLPLHPGAVSCVRSGFCCKKGPCPFGESGEDGSCTRLIKDDQGVYACEIADWIMTQPGWEFSPAFGAGCCMPLFNPEREKILNQMRKETGRETETDDR